MVLFALFVLVPIIEISLFVVIGGMIGLWPTLALVIGSALLGMTLVRSQGQQAMQRLQSSFDHQQDPTKSLVHGAMTIMAGLMLIVPGFFTDALGLLLLIPQVREAAFAHMRSRMVMSNIQFATQRGRGSTSYRNQSDVIDGEFEDVTPKPRTGPSQWVNQSDDSDR